ncbi:MAG: DNA_ligase_IV_Ku-like, partial [uncultured Solirubrobacteraceae bacterium]
GASARSPRPAPARQVGQGPADRLHVGLRAEVGWLPLHRVRRRRRRAPPVAQRQAAHPLLPGARLPAGALRARRGDRPLRRPGPTGLRRPRPARAPGRVADRDARQGDADALRRVRPARARRRGPPRAPAGGAPRRARGARRPARRPHALDARPRGGQALAARGGGRHRQGLHGALPARRARRHGQDQARPDHGGRGPRVAAGQGARHGRLAHPRPLRRRRRATRRRPHLGVQGGREARAGGQAQAVRDGRHLRGRALALEQHARARRGGPAARARGRGHLRPREQRPHPARGEDHALARGQAPARVHARSARRV